MHPSLAKQDAFIANVNFKVLPINEAPALHFTGKRTNVCLKPVHYITCHLVTLHIKNIASLLKLKFVANIKAR
jgi:hypothetical protein